MVSRDEGTGHDVVPAGGRGEAGAGLFVWATWALMLGSLAVVVGLYGRRLPFGDDWDVVSHYLDASAPSAGWFWEPHNEHRVPLLKLMLWGLYEGSGYDMRSALLFNVASLGALAAVLLGVLRGIRGGWRVTDAAIPLLLLNWSNCAFQWSFELHFTTAVLLMGGALAVIASHPAGLGPGGALAAGLILVLTSMTGGQGVVLGAGLVAWAGMTGLLQVRGTWRGGRLGGAILVTMAAGAAAAMGASVVGLRGTVSVNDEFHSANGREFASAAYLMLNAGLRQAVPRFWRELGAGLTLAYAVATGGLLAALAGGRRGPREWGMLLLLAGVALLDAALAWGRGRLLREAMMHYGMLTVIGLCWLYFALELYAPARAGRPLQAALLCLAAICAARGVDGLDDRLADYRDEQAALSAMRSGIGPTEMTDRELDNFSSEAATADHPEGVRLRRLIIESLGRLRDAGYAPYNGLGQDGPQAGAGGRAGP